MELKVGHMAPSSKRTLDRDLRWVMKGDGGCRLVGELLSGDIDRQSSVLIILPTERMCRYAKSLVATGGGGVTGSILTPRGLATELHERSGSEGGVMDLSMREILVREVLKEPGRTSLAPDTPPRGGMVRSIAQTIGELLMNGITPEDLKGKGMSKRAVELSSVYKGYLDRIKERGLIDPEQVPWMVLEGIDAGRIALLWDTAGAHLLGSLEKGYLELVSRVLSRMDRAVVEEHVCRQRPTYAPWPGEKPNERPPFIIPSVEEGRRCRVIHEGSVMCLEGEDRTDEVRRIARWIKRRLVGGSIRPDQASAVFPSRHTYDPVIRYIFPQYGLPIEQGQDMMLLSVPSAEAAWSLLRLPLSGFKRGKVISALSNPYLRLHDGNGAEIEGDEIALISREAYIIGGGRDPAGSWTGPLKNLSVDPEAPERIRELSGRLLKPIKDLFDSLMELSRARGKVPQLLDRVSGILGSLNLFEKIAQMRERSSFKDGMDRLERLDHEGALKFVDALRTVARNSKVAGLGEVAYPELLELLEMELVKGRTSSLGSSSGIKILGLEECAGIPFSMAVIGGCTERDLPSLDLGFSVLNDEERARLKLPSRLDRRGHLEDLCITLNTCEGVVLSYPLMDGNSPVLRSSFIDGLDLKGEDDDGTLMSEVEVQKTLSEVCDPIMDLYSPRGRPMDPLRYDKERLLSLFDDEVRRNLGTILSSWRSGRMLRGEDAGVLLSDELKVHLVERFGSGSVWSVSRLETYRKCPYSFFAKYVLGIEPFEEMEIGVPPDRAGLIFHSIAERFYRRSIGMGRPRIRPGDVPAAKALIREEARGVFSSYPFSGPYWDALQDQFLGASGTDGLLDEFVISESMYTGSFSVGSTELKFGPMGRGSKLPCARIKLPSVGEEGASFDLMGSIDRVDVSTNGASFIWDYKTGTGRIDRDSLQVPLYLAALREVIPGSIPIGGGYYYVRRKGDIERIGAEGIELYGSPAIDEGELGKQAASARKLIDEGIERAFEAIEGIRSGDFRLTEERCRKKDCGYFDLCRKGEMQ